MANTDRLTLVTSHAVTLLKQAGNVALHGAAAADIYWPDQTRIPRTPAICVDSGPYDRTLSGEGGKGRTDNNFTVYVLCYLCKVQDVQITEQSVEAMSETVMDILHQDMTWGGLVIYGHVAKIEPGYSVRNGVLFRSSRITWEGLTRTLIA